ncbi:MFS transporter [Denitromonas iodatirespirans]|uniref:MFS transporter n=1 Tax=Denitromonas iodatirespirans TaxID=2795389 RepID=A0A944HD09_DENI1|nr:MFS transporter [Denitromonas iodatirespirans]MBT0961646.1 MFS transporter [Denitromonas iodatirespirans]
MTETGPDATSTSPFLPLADPVFRSLWAVWLAANLCLWMNDVAAAWLMIALSGTPLMVALVQSASTLPVFLFGVPSGALADIVDRRRYLMFTQFWVAAVALLICLAMAFDLMSPGVLLVLTFANGLGLAMRWPVFAAVIAELVPREQLPVATALSGMAMNTSRILGPLLAGMLIATLGPVAVFALNAMVSVLAGAAIYRWRRPRVVTALPSERFFGAIRVGLQHVRASTRMRAVLRRAFAFAFSSIALLAMLPLLAKQQYGGGAQTFTILMAAMGGGAICGAMLLPRIRRRFGRDRLVDLGCVLHASAAVGAALAPNLYVALPALFAGGLGWISTANALNVSAHFALPDWVRARGMAFYQMAMMGGNALGAACWGQVAGSFSLRTGLLAAACATVVGWLLTRRLPILGDPEEGPLMPPVWKAPEAAIPIDFRRGPVQVTVEYRIDPARADDFVQLMSESRRVWLQNGVLSWNLLRDVSDSGRFFEQFVDESWADYLRRHERITATHVALKRQKLSFHRPEAQPMVTRCIAERIPR